MRKLCYLSLLAGVLLLFTSKISRARNTIPVISSQNFTPVLDEDDFFRSLADNIPPYENSTFAEFTLALTDVADPIAADDSYAVDENTSLNIGAPGVLGNDTDADADDLTAVLVTGPSSGSLTLNGDGSFTYTPNAGFSGSDSFTYHATDGTTNSNDAIVTIAVNEVNSAPVAGNDSYAVDENTSLNIAAPGVLGNDTDADADNLTAVLVTGPSSGSLTLNADGSFTYTPNADFVGDDSFTYQATDGTTNSNDATVTIAVNEVNSAPVAGNDSYAVDENASLNIGAPGVLGNDTDADADNLTAVLVTGPSSGSLTLNADGSFTYTPNTDFVGDDSFTYYATDGTTNSNDATVTIAVNEVNSAPVAANDSYTVDENASLNIAAPGVLGNDTDADADNLTAVLVTGPSSGSLTLNADGGFTYTPNTDFVGDDSFTYQANDGTTNSNDATVTIAVNEVNSAPVAGNDSYAVDENTSLNIAAPGVLGNDTDADADNLTAVLVTGPSSGSLTLNADGGFTYTPNTDFVGDDSFTYHATDGTTNSNDATVIIAVNEVNSAPIAGNDSYAVDENTTLNIAAPGVLSNDTDADGDGLTAVLVTGPSSGSLTLNGDGSFIYTPNTNFVGDDSFTYHATDGTTNSNDATVTIAVNEVNSAPVAGNDSYAVDENTSLNIAAPGILSNDIDADADDLTAVLVTGPSSGSLLLNADGSFTYTPNTDFVGDDSFTYHANDGTTNSNDAIVTIAVNEVNSAPVAANDSYAVDENASLNIGAPGVLGNDTDADADNLTAVLVTGPSSGSLTLNADGSFTYTPNTDFVGDDSFTYHATDGTTNSNNATVTIAVNEVNSAPVAANDSYSTNEDTPLTIAAPGVLSNDTDADADNLTSVLVTGPSSGSLTLNADGGFTYTPNAGFSGSDSFTYQATDGTTNSNVATVILTINNVNSAPVATNDSYFTNEDTPLTIAAPGVLGNDTDADGETLTAIVDVTTSNGSLTLNADGSFTYTPNANYNGSDSFTYHANDGTTNSNVATVIITINNVNDAPVAVDDGYVVNEDAPLTITAPGVLINDTDVDGGTLIAVLNTSPSNGSLTLNTNGSFTYTPNADFNGIDSFTYYANDGTANSNVATVTITVTPVNDAPVAIDDSYTTDEDIPLIVVTPGVLGNDTSDGGMLSASIGTGPLNGILALNANGSFNYAPNANYNGSDSFTYRANDGMTDSNVATVTLTINAVNDPPLAIDDSYATNEDTPLTIAAPGVLGNDIDIDGGPLIAAIGTTPSNGSLALNIDGSFTYIPAASYHGSDTFTYHANDGIANSNAATVTITVNSVDDAPVAEDDSYTIDEDTQLSVAAPGVLGNDTDGDLDDLTAVLVNGPSNGVLTLNADGSFTYTPNANYNGPDSFTYHAFDGTTNSNDATVTITVNGVNDAPVAVDDSYTIDEDTQLSVAAPGVLGNDTDADADALTAVLVNGPSNGVLTLNTDGSFTYTPNANYNGPDSFTYHAFDGITNSNDVTVTITVNAVNDSPVAVNDSYEIQEDTQLSIAAPGVLGNDTDDDLDDLTAVLVNGPSNGVLTLNPDGSFTYTPNANYNGPDSFTYHANDGSTNSNDATVTITVTGVNDPPSFAFINDVEVNEDATAQVINITDISQGGPGETGTLTLTASSDNVGVVPNPVVTYNGTASNGTLTFQPVANQSGVALITVRLVDAGSLDFIQTFTITVNPVNDAPTLNAVSNVFVPKNAPAQVISLAGITAGPGESQSLTVTATHNAPALLDDIIVNYTSPNSTGSITVTPLPNVFGPATVTVRVEDNGSSSPPNVNFFERTFTFTVIDVNSPPTIDPIDNVTIDEDSPAQVVDITGISPGPSETGSVTITATSSDPAIVPNPVVTHDGTSATGSLTFQPVANRNGTVTISVRAVDEGAAEFTRTFAVTVNAVNDAPTLNAIANVSVEENSPAQVINLTGISAGNAFETQTLTVTASHDNSTLLDPVTVSYTSANPTGTLTITPKPNVSGTATVTVTVTDNGSSVSPNVNTFQRTFTFTVNDVNDPPFFDVIANVSVLEDAGAQTVNITGISPGVGETGTVTLFATSSNTAIIPDPTITYDGTSTSAILNYQSEPDRNGTITITVRAVDAGSLEFTRTFTINVQPVNDAPTLDAIADVSVNEDAPLQTITLSGISDGSAFETQMLSMTVSSNNSALFEVLAVNYTSPQVTGVLNIQPKANITGSATVTVTVTDSGSGTAPSVNTFSRSFTFTVNDVNDPPTFNPISNVNILEDAASQTINITGISAGPGETQEVMLLATSGNTSIIPNPVIAYDGVSSTATLTFEPEPNQSGSVIITVRAIDEESAEYSQTFTINVQSVNDAPTLDALGNITIQEDDPEQTINLTGITAGPLENQTLTVTASTGQLAYFDVFAVTYTSPQSTGLLRIKPKENVAGMATITVTVTDNGSNVSPNVNTISRTFNLTIEPVNDPPVITNQSNITINEDQSFTIQLSHITIQDPDNTSGFTLSVAGGANYSVSGNTITPSPHYYGPLTVPITVSDGTASSAPFSFAITVSPVNDAPEIIGQNPVSIEEAQPIELTLGMLLVEDHDPEDIYPDDYTLNVLSGPNYSVSGNTVTPALNFSGVLTVRVFVNDGQANSNTYDLQIQVDFVNDPPVITGQNVAITINEEQSTTLSVTQLNISDPDNGPGDFTLTILPNTNYTFSGLTVTPNENFFGDLSVFVTVSDGFVNSAPFTMHITVVNVNDAPVITGQNAVTTAEDTPVTLKLTDLLVTDVDNPYPGTFTMTASPGTNYTVSGLTITPALNYFGMITVPVVVNDGLANSNTFSLQIQVTPVNDPPVIAGQTPNPLTTSEDIPVTIEFENLQVTDVESPNYPTGFSIIVQSGTNYTFNGTTITPAQDYVGPITVVLRVSDGSALSLPFNFQIMVADENDPPVISGQHPVSVNEDVSLTIELSHLIIEDPDDDTFTLTVLSGSNYTVSGTTITPSPNFFGNLSVRVRVNDGVNNSAIYLMAVQVTPVNDPPSFDPLADLILAENAPAQNIEIQNISPGPLENQQLNLTIVSSHTDVIKNPTVTYNGTATSYIFTIQPEVNRTGEVTITVTVTDPGLLQFTRSFNVSVTHINDPPTLDPITFGPILEDAPLQSINLTGITAGPQESQFLTVTASTDEPELFEIFSVTYTNPQTTGTLNIKPKADVFGTASITVKVTDDGSNVAPHKNFIERTFTLTITPVNDAPVFVSTPIETAVIGEVYEYAIEVTDVDPDDVITITAIEMPSWLTLTAQGNGLARLSGTPPANAVGAVSVKLQAKDTGNAMTSQDYTLRINTRPVVSDFSVSLNEDALKPIGLPDFTNAYLDADNDALQKVQIVELPGYGQLLLNSQVVNPGQEIEAASLANLAYRPQQDYAGNDTIVWKASDALNYSLNNARIFLSISPVNDPPVIVALEQEILEFSVGEGPGVISTVFEAIDVDNETLTGAEIGFRRQNFVPQIDILNFINTPKITGTYDAIAGILILSGVATVQEYNMAIRTITYDNISEVFTDQQVIKTIYYTVNDGIALSDTRDREIRLIDLFEELVIPKGFTPNNDPKNNTWAITNINRYTEAIVKVYNIRGMEVYSSEGIYEEWDGTYKDKFLPSDTYYYVIDLNLPFRKKVYTGAVTILR